MTDQLLPRRAIFCAYKNFEELKARYPKRQVIPDKYQQNDIFTVIKRYPRGVFNVRMSDWTVWVPHVFPFFRRWR